MKAVVPLISCDEAQIFLSKKLFFKKKIVHAELIYIPGYMFSVSCSHIKKNHLNVFVDSIIGEFALLSSKNQFFDYIIQKEKILREIPIDQAREIAVNEMKRMFLWRSLKTKKKIPMDIITDSDFLMYPYWIGYFKKKEKIDFQAIDAVSGKEQGAKMKPLFIQYLISENKANRL